jgi:hypothetical protein
VLKFLSQSNIVIAPPNTGNVKSNKKDVIKSAHTNNGNLKKYKPPALILKTVVIKFIAPEIDAIPARCKEKIAKSVAAPECACILDNGG